MCIYVNDYSMYIDIDMHLWVWIQMVKLQIDLWICWVSHVYVFPTVNLVVKMLQLTTYIGLVHKSKHWSSHVLYVSEKDHHPDCSFAISPLDGAVYVFKNTWPRLVSKFQWTHHPGQVAIDAPRSLQWNKAASFRFWYSWWKKSSKHQSHFGEHLISCSALTVPMG